VLKLVTILHMTRRIPPEKNRQYQAEFDQRMREEHKQVKLWVRFEEVERLKRIAIEQGWLHESGRYKGQPNVQKAALELLNKAIAAEEVEQMGENSANEKADA